MMPDIPMTARQALQAILARIDGNTEESNLKRWSDELPVRAMSVETEPYYMREDIRALVMLGLRSPKENG